MLIVIQKSQITNQNKLEARNSKLEIQHSKLKKASSI